MIPARMRPWLIVLSLCACPVLVQASEASPEQALQQLISLQSFVGKDNLSPPTDGLDSTDCGVRLLSAALLYRREPDAHRNAFFAALVIDDYDDRANGRYNMVDGAAAAAALESAMDAPDGVTHESVRRVVAFCALRDRNLWVSRESQPRISLARMVRSAALVSLLEGTDEDALAIANAVDRLASAERD